MARPPRANLDWLARQIRRMHDEGLSYKHIARQIGYSYDHTMKLGRRLGIIKHRLKPKEVIDLDPQST